eukprot:IDg8978t1
MLFVTSSMPGCAGNRKSPVLVIRSSSKVIPFSTLSPEYPALEIRSSSKAVFRPLHRRHIPRWRYGALLR